MITEQTAREFNQLFGLNQSDENLRKLRYRWPCSLVAQEMGDFLVVPLTSSRELASEGWNLQHCVASYDSDCANGIYQVFSIRDLLGNRIATLGLTYGPIGWKVDQCLGFSNVEVLLKSVEWIQGDGIHESMDDFTDLHYLAQEVARLLNRATRVEGFILVS